MTYIKIFILAIVQGIAEAFPISSSGHLVVLNRILKMNELSNENFLTLLNLGSLFGVILFFRKDIINLTKSFFLYLKNKNQEFYNDYKYCLMVIVATIPAGLAGILLKKYLKAFTNNPKLIGYSLLFTALVLFSASYKKGKKTSEKIGLKESIIIGLSQILTLFPGISRSGMTTSTALLNNVERESAFKFSYMMYIPISFAVLLLDIKDIVSMRVNPMILVTYITAMIISGICTYFCLNIMKKILVNGKLKYIALYCLTIGILIIMFIK